MEGAIGLFVVPWDVHWYIQYHYSIYNNSINSYLQYILAVTSFWFYCGTTGSQSLPWVQIKLLKCDNFPQQSGDGKRFGQSEGTCRNWFLSFKTSNFMEIELKQEEEEKKTKKCRRPQEGNTFVSLLVHIFPCLSVILVLSLELCRKRPTFLGDYSKH